MGFGVEMQTILYLVYGAALLAAGFAVFRRILVREYLTKGRLGGPASILQFAMFVAFFFLPYLYLPPEWAWDWLPNGTWNRLMAIVLVIAGMGPGIRHDGLVWDGPRFRRSGSRFEKDRCVSVLSQPADGGGLVDGAGCVLLRAVWYSMGWSIIWGFIGYWMVTTEETHLRRVFGEEYLRYCRETPRYLLRWHRS
jgi:hypothetical protein